MRRTPILVAAALACAQPPAPPPGSAGPSEAVQDFAAALQKQDAAAAWALLSTRTQAEANKRAPDGNGRAMLFGSALPGAPIAVSNVQQSGDTAEVRTNVPDGGGAGTTYRVVREGGRWRVDLDLGR
jgi:hypothetical protein